MSSTFAVEVDVDDVIVGIDSMIRKLSPPGLRMFLRSAVRPILVQRAEQRFDSEGDDASRKWAQLAEATWFYRRRDGFPPKHPINIRTGQLKSFVLSSYALAAAGGSGAALTMPGSAPAGQLFKKLKGAQLGDGDTPSRPVLAMSSTDHALIGAAFEKFIQTA